MSMEPTPHEEETDFLQALRGEYEGKGYQFYIHPNANQVPAFLGPYQPDAIATSPKGSIVIEVKARRTVSNEPRLSEIARLVEGHPGWKFRVYYRSGISPKLYDAPTKSSVQGQFIEAEKLFAARHTRAAFVMAWAAIEAAARAINSQTDRSRPMMPRELVEWLAHAGYIDPSTSRELRTLVNVRNAVVHGALEVSVERGHFMFLKGILRSLLDEME